MGGRLKGKDPLPPSFNLPVLVDPNQNCVVQG